LKTGPVWLTLSVIVLCVAISAAAAYIFPHAGTRLARGEAYLAKGDTAAALAEFEHVLQSGAEKEATEAVALALIQAGSGMEGEILAPDTGPQIQPPEDYVIQWQDPALESLIRAALDREHGDILASELGGIYDICVLGSRYTGINMLSRGSPDDFSALLAEYESERAGYEGISLSGLSDLRHFGELALVLLYDCGSPAGAPESVAVIIK
jgi:hypothetical protein